MGLLFKSDTMYRFSTIAIVAAGIAISATDGFVSLMPRQDVTEFWTIEGTPASSWRVEDGEIFCQGYTERIPAKQESVQELRLRAEWRFKKEGWIPKPQDEGWPNAGFFIHAGPVVKGWPTSLEVQGPFW